jgi:GAF domain-containing protein
MEGNMSSKMGGIATTVRFLQEENQRLSQLNEELMEENSYLRDCLKSIRGLQGTVENLDTHIDLQRLLNRIVYESIRIVDGVDGSLLLVDDATQELVFVVVRGTLQEQLQGYRIPLDTGIAGWVMTHREPVIENDVKQNDRFSSVVDSMFQFRRQSLMCVPLISRDKVWGVIEVINNFSGRPFEERDLEMLLTLAPLAATAIDLANVTAEE